eukprot:Hpha_TRINITY_DN24236_c0_g1::TRINITY_DN24236_c0_g1_i1::g.36123::m.36123
MASPPGSPTADQAKVVKDIIGSGGDLSQLLGIDDSSEFSAIKSRYRRMVVKVHPDKNPHPDAAKAFQLLQQTFDQAEAFFKLRDQAAKVEATATVHTAEKGAKTTTATGPTSARSPPPAAAQPQPQQPQQPQRSQQPQPQQ